MAELDVNVPDLNFGDLLDAVAAEVPERLAVIHGERILSWRTFDERSNRLARYLHAQGLSPDSKVAFYLRNTPAYLELFAACAKARCVHANVNYRYVDDELHHVLHNSDAEVVAYDAEFRPHIEALGARLPKVRAYLEVGAGPVPGFADSFDAACREGDASPLAMSRSGDDLYFMYTGGTTGYPKAVMWRHKDRIAVIGMTTMTDPREHARAVAEAEPIVALPACPLMHSTGFTTAVSTLIGGGCVVLLPDRRFDAGVCLAEIERNRVSRVAIVGDAFSVPILEHLRAHGGRYDLSSVQLITSAGAMWSEHCKQGLLDFFPNAVLSDSLGSSEGSRLGAAITRRGEAAKTASFQLGPGVKVFTEDFREVAAGSGEAGMIAKSGPLPVGYYKDPAGTAKTFPVVDGVRYSMAGDWCRIEADGSMTLLGRGNNCINTGGEKVYPEEVEEVLKALPEIADAAVVGIPDERWGQAVVALVRLTGEATFDAQAVRGHLDRHLARYKHPKRLHRIDEDFRHDNGKVNYRLVRRLLEGAPLAPS
ncbi:MAG TPA: acyl-CoA synthetase [Pseudomonadales bacterium]